MIDKVVNLLKQEPFYVPNILIKNYKKLEITDEEFIILIYLINSDDNFNPKLVASDLNFSLNDVLEIITSLVEKNMIKIDIVNNKVREEKINLDSLYNKLVNLIVNNEEEQDMTIFTVIEKEFGRTLSPIDYEIISEWQKEYSNDLIKLALREATFNNVKSLKYIDKILYDWNQKGIKTEEDIIKEKQQFESKKSNKKLFDYDWINERDN